MRKYIYCLLLAVAAMTGVQANEAPLAADNPQLEERVMALSHELRCLVCQNQTLADSHADLAVDLKNQIREKMAGGMSDQEVVDYMVERYGDFVMYRPPVKMTTWILWFGPFVLLIGGIAVLMRRLARGRGREETLPEAQRQRAAALLADAAETKDVK